MSGNAHGARANIGVAAVPEAERGPGRRGGETALPGAPPLTRLAVCPQGILWPGLSNSMPGSRRVQ
jgi:hypothetical protein